MRFSFNGIVSLVALALLGCAAQNDAGSKDEGLPSSEEVEVAKSSAAIETGCPSDAPLCSCALRGQDICKDPDGDGLLSLYDNCRYVSNPGQQNCDGDSYGDACDSMNVRISQYTTQQTTSPIKTGRFVCQWDPGITGATSWAEFQTTTTTRTFERRAYCGPSGGGIEERLLSTNTQTSRCWTIDGLSCSRPANVLDPLPYCAFSGFP